MIEKRATKTLFPLGSRDKQTICKLVLFDVIWVTYQNIFINLIKFLLMLLNIGLLQTKVFVDIIIWYS